MTLSDTIIKLSSVSAPSGFEDAAAEAITELISPYADEVSTDVLGNVIALRSCGRPEAKRLMLCAHMDEVGLIIRGEEKGFLRFSTLGGLDARILPARVIKILANPPIFGVIDTLPPHVLSGEEMEKSIDTEKLFIDAGLSSEEARRLAPPGTPAVFAGGCDSLLDKELCGKALDNRVCVAILIRLFELLADEILDVDVYALFSVQEEVGLRGSRTGAFSIAPDCCLTLDTTHAQTPDGKPGRSMKMGGGAAIAVGPAMNRALTDKLISLAKEAGICNQIEVEPGNPGADCWEIQVSRAGVKSALCSVPVKYMHSAVETVSLSDAEAVLKLSLLLCQNAREVM